VTPGKRRGRVDSHSNALSVERDERLCVEDDHPVDSVCDAAEMSAAQSLNDDTVIDNPNVNMDTTTTENNGGC